MSALNAWRPNGPTYVVSSWDGAMNGTPVTLATFVDGTSNTVIFSEWVKGPAALPGPDGLETMGRMLSQDNRLPVILNTAYSSYKESFLSWSADAYVVKSSDLTELKTKIREVLDARAAEERTRESR